MPWHFADGRLLPRNAASRHAYRGVNILSLWAAQIMRSYSSNLWASYRQWQSNGAQVRRGEAGTSIIYYGDYEREETNDLGETVRKKFLVARSSIVFNADQVDGFARDSELPVDRTVVHDQAERFIVGTGARVIDGIGHACYYPLTDTISIPARIWFLGTATSNPTEAYYSTLFHELTHWTGAGHRLNRHLSTRFASDAYAMEELTAELGAAFLSAHLEIANEPRLDHAAYVQSWLTVLKSDKKAIFVAAAKASLAVDYLSELQRSQHAKEREDESRGLVVLESVPLEKTTLVV